MHSFNKKQIENIRLTDSSSASCQHTISGLLTEGKGKDVKTNVRGLKSDYVKPD